MNIKERLKDGKKVPERVKEQKSTNKNENITELFGDEKYVQNLIKNYCKNRKNIIYVMENNMDSALIGQYIKFFINKTIKVKIANHLIDNKEESKINVVTSPTIIEIVRILEEIITTEKSYIFGLSLRETNNILDKLRALILINYPNLNETDINILFSSSNLVVVYFGRNEDGLYVITGIEELTTDNASIIPERVFDRETSYILTDERSNTKEETNINQSNNESLPNNDNSLEGNEIIVEVKSNEESYQNLPLITVNNTKPKKINKYKLLKDKIKRKKEAE